MPRARSYWPGSPRGLRRLDEKAGAAGSVFDVLRERRLNHWTEVLPEVREAECAGLLREFFAARRPGA
ncbi:tRNA-specific adenosine deaminase [Rothia kristinae]|nr:tRNA-specific adenosine deaminase [Rothia kristinae]